MYLVSYYGGKDTQLHILNDQLFKDWVYGKLGEDCANTSKEFISLELSILDFLCNGHKITT